MSLRLSLALTCLLGLAQVAFSQTLPRGLSAEERAMIENGYQPDRTPVAGALEPASLSSAPRSIAEWEELQAIAITWTGYKSILAEIVRHAVNEVDVYIVTTNESAVRQDLVNADIDPDSNIVYIDSDFNSIWIRDYGPNPAYTSDVDSLVIVDWIYNRPRPKDDRVPIAIADHMGVPLLSTTQSPSDLVNTGGNYMTDGLGRAFSSELVIEENGPGNIWGESNHDEGAIDSLMQVYMGINEYVKMDVLPYDGIHHIDMHMKLLDENTLLVGQYPEGIADGPQIEANLQYVIENFKMTTGRDYKVVRIPMPPDQFGRYPHQNGYYRTYANALIVNKTILVPTYEVQFDTTALRIWEETMPGYNIVGINCNQIIPASGALHCITKEIGVDGPLWIWHDGPVMVDYSVQVPLEAIMKHRTGIAEAHLFYRKSGEEEYTSKSLSMTSEDIWQGVLEGAEPGDTIQYYFEGLSNSGKRITRPMVAPDGYYTIFIEESSTSVAEVFTNGTDLKVFPNPATGLTCVQFMMDRPESVAIELFDVHGALVLSIASGRRNKGEQKVFLDVSDLPSGAYVVSINGEKTSLRQRLIVL